MKSQLCFLTVLATVVANVVPGVVPSSRAAISNAVDSPKSTTLLAQESGFDYRNYAFWAQQCLFLSEGADPEKTLETCETAISIRPRRQNLELWFARSVALFQLGEYAEAIASFGKVVDTAPQDSISIAYQCASFHQLSQWEQAVETCEEALEIDGNWGTDSPAIAWYYRALALQSMGRLTTALSSYERALALTPDDLTIRAGRCALAAELDQGDRCTLAEAMVAYEQVLAETPDNATLWFQQGLALEQLGKYEQALASYEGAIAITPDDSLTLAHQCGVLNQIGEFEAALAACDAALAGNGHWDGLGPVFGWSQRSSAQLGLEAYELALASADRAISIDDSYPGGWNHRAVSLWHLGHLDEAMAAILSAREQEEEIIPLLSESFDRAYSESPIFFYRRSALISYNQGSILLDLYSNNSESRIYSWEPVCPYSPATLLEQADCAYHRATALQQDWAEKLTGGSLLDNNMLSNLWTNRSVVARYENDPHKSADFAAKARNYNSDSLEAWLNLGGAYAAISQYSEARKAYEAVAEQDPERINPEDINYILGQSALENLHYEFAWNTYTTAAIQDPTRADAVVGQGLALQGLGTHCDLQAIQVFEHALNLDPSDPVAQRHYAQLIQTYPQPRAPVSENSTCPIVLE